MCPLSFWKMQGAGNDFVVLEGLRVPVKLTPALVRRICDRRLGVGADQLLLVEQAEDPQEADFRYRIFNADGSEVEQCGNGARAVGRFLLDKRLAVGPVVRLRAQKSVISVWEAGPDAMSVDMGEPDFRPEIPSDRITGLDCGLGERIVPIGVELVRLRTVSMGNPHAVLEVKDVSVAPVATFGPILEKHPAFPLRTNVEFVEMTSRRTIRMRVWERGAGETPSCGTGACAAVAVGIAAGRLDAGVDIEVSMPGGRLLVCWQGPGAGMFLTGPVQKVFEGVFAVEDECVPSEE